MLYSLNRFGVSAVLTPAFVISALSSAVHAQVQTVTPYYALVTSDKAVVRSGDNERFYKVGEIASGTIVMVDGEGNSWSRIAYPGTLFSFVKVEDVKVEGAAATLTGPSKLKAANLTAGYTGSWKSLLDVPLPAGTALKVIEPAKEGDTVVGYKVSAPESARAFVETRALRRATDTEVAKFKEQGNAPALPAAATPIAGKAPVGSPVNAANGNPGVVPSQPAPGSVPGTTTADVGKGVQPVKTDARDGMDNPGDFGVDVTPKKAGADTKAANGERTVASMDDLENRLKEVWKQEKISEDLVELRSEYVRAVDATPEGDASRRKALQSRVDLIDMRMKLRDTIRDEHAAVARLDSSKAEVAKQVEEWDKTRVYTIVGELQPSTVYDGKHLPLMFRVVSVGGTSPRTLGYLKPTEEVNLTKMLGQVVGVIGEASMDRSLKLNIINPIKVDTLRSRGTGRTTTETTAKVEGQSDTESSSPAEK